MEKDKNCDYEETEEKLIAEENVEDENKRLNIRKDSLFLTRKRLSKEGKKEIDFDVVKTINRPVDPISNVKSGVPFQIKVDASISEYGSNRKTEVNPTTEKQRHVIIIEDELRENDKKGPKNETNVQKY